MLIDWFTVGAQIVNFLILMALLKIFLYDRVVRAMDAREEKIAARLEEARRKQRSAEDERKEVEAEKQSLEDRRQQMLSEAAEEARAKQKELEEQARGEVDARRTRWRKALDEEKERFAREVVDSTLRHALAVARRVVEGMADDDFQERLVARFTDRIRHLSSDEKNALLENWDADAPTASVVSGATIATAQRQQITRLLHEKIHPDLDVGYHTTDDRMGGVELRLDGKKMAWSPREYIDDLRDALLHKLTAGAAMPPDEETPNDERGDRNGRRG